MHLFVVISRVYPGKHVKQVVAEVEQDLQLASHGVQIPFNSNEGTNAVLQLVCKQLLFKRTKGVKHFSQSGLLF